MNPPQLPAGAKPVREDTLTKGWKNQKKVKAINKIMKHFPLFNKKKKVYLVVADQEDIPKAVEMGKQFNFEIVVAQGDRGA